MTISGARMETAMTQITAKNTPQRASANVTARRENASDAFGEKLRALEGQEEKGAESEAEEQLVVEETAPIPLTAALDAPRGAMPLAAVAPAAPAAPAMPNEIAQAHIDRMAAAIAEAVSKPGHDVLTLDFGNELALVKSAIVARDAAGMITITMVTPNAAMQPNAWAALRSQLADRLDKRKLNVKSIKLDDGKEQRPPAQGV
jgi:hypothetical protein